jgi:hypothetical protein
MILTSNRGFAEWGSSAARRRHGAARPAPASSISKAQAIGSASTPICCPNMSHESKHPACAYPPHRPTPWTAAKTRKRRSRHRLIARPATWGILLRSFWSIAKLGGAATREAAFEQRPFLGRWHADRSLGVDGELHAVRLGRKPGEQDGRSAFGRRWIAQSRSPLMDNRNALPGESRRSRRMHCHAADDRATRRPADADHPRGRQGLRGRKLRQRTEIDAGDAGCCA